MDNILEILEIIRTKPDSELVTALEEYHENDIALAFKHLTDEELDRMYRVLPTEMLSEIITFTDSPEEYIEDMDSEKAADVIEEMDADDAVDVLEDVSPEVKEELAKLIDDEVLEDIQLIRSYDDDEVGSLITTNFITVKKDYTVKEVMKTVVGEASENDNLNVIFVLNEDETYYGLILLADLICARAETPLEDIIKTAYPVLSGEAKIDDSIDLLKDYDLDSIAVLDGDSKIVGVITKTDIVELIDSTYKEDYAKLAGMKENDDISEPLGKSVIKRLPWLVVLMIFGLVESLVLSGFEGVIAILPIVVFFQSMILDMGGNVGTQSLAVAIRNISLSDELGKKKIFKLIGRDVLIGLIDALIVGIGAFAFVFVYLLINKSLGADVTRALLYATVVGVSLMIAMTVSAFVGVFIPILLTKLHVDPAAASGPFITTINDLVALCIYYGLAMAFMPLLLG